MSDYVPDRYAGVKNAVYWMATKRHDWWGLVILLAYIAVVAVAVGVALAQRGASSALPWLSVSLRMG